MSSFVRRLGRLGAAVGFVARALRVRYARWRESRINARVAYHRAEARALRRKVDELSGGKRLCLPVESRRAIAIAARRLTLAELREVATVARPETIRRWFRELVARRYRPRRRGRPRTPEETVALVLQVARESKRYGYTRIRDVVRNLGGKVSETTIARILKEHGVPTAPDREGQETWGEFLRLHADGLFAADFFHVHGLRWFRVVRYAVFFVIEHKTRRVHVAGITAEPLGRRRKSKWVEAMGRRLVAPGGFLERATHLVLDRDPLYTRVFRKTLEEAGVEVVRTAPRAPRMNSIAERCVRSIKHECLNYLIPLSEAQLRHAIEHYLAHYHTERNHQGLDSAIIDPPPDFGPAEGKVVLKTRLGGLLHHRVREAA